MEIKYNDRSSIFWLLVLYTLQGVPLGMAAVFPMLLKERGAHYSELAWFSACSWPFSLKLLWAPLVDSLRFPGQSLRKSWSIPTQILLAIGFWFLADHCEGWLEDHQIGKLTLAFLWMYFSILQYRKRLIHCYEHSKQVNPKVTSRGPAPRLPEITKRT